MIRRPQGSLDDLTVPKDAPEPPPAPVPPVTSPVLYGGKMKTYAHTLSLRLTSKQYETLRRHAIRHETRTGERLTHQSIIESALLEWLRRNG